VDVQDLFSESHKNPVDSFEQLSKKPLINDTGATIAVFQVELSDKLPHIQSLCIREMVV
jgi:hypothetical protein